MVVHDPARSQSGYNLVGNRALGSAVLFDAEGSEVHSWKVDDIEHWANAELLEDGDLLISGAKTDSGTGYLIDLAWDGSERWRARIGSHHDAELLPNGQIAALCRQNRMIPEIETDVKVKDHCIAILNREGKLLAKHSIYDLLAGGPADFEFQHVERMEETKLEILDLLHSNSIEFMRRPELEARNAIYSLDNVLVSIRHQDSVAIFDWKQKRLVWAWGQGELSGQHDATVLDNGNLLIFDNGLESRRSRVIELDPLRREVVWQYQGDADGFFTLSRGSSQRLPNGNTLFANSESGEALEVTPDGEVVWRFLNPAVNEKGQRATIVRIKRYPLEQVDALLHPVRDDLGP